MPASVIAAVELLATRDKQEGNFEFTDQHGNIFETTEDEGEANQPTDSVAGVDEETYDENPFRDAQEDSDEGITESDEDITDREDEALP
jgi:hypothetical protein